MQRRAVLLAILVMVLAANASYPAVEPEKKAPTLTCVEGLKPFLRTTLYTDRSNRNSPTGKLNDAEWQAFVDDVLLKHFRRGGTVYSNIGWWQRPNGTVGGGPGHTIVVLAPAEEVTARREAVKAVINEIKTRHGHLSVGWEESWVCAGF